MSVNETLERNFEKLRKRKNVLNVTLGTRVVNGVDTGEPAIVVKVRMKLPINMLRASDMLPREINGVPVDVQEMSTPDYQLGDTIISKKPPSIQRRIAGGVRK